MAKAFKAFKSAPPYDMNNGPNQPAPSAEILQNASRFGILGPGAGSSIPNALLEQFLPGYSLISTVLEHSFGIEINKIITALFVAFTFFTAAKYIWTRLSSFWSHYLMSSITINNDEKIYRYIMDWVSETKIPKASRNLCAKSRKKDWEEELDLIKAYNEGDDSFNFKEWESKSVPSFEPAIGVHRFWHKGNFITFTRRERDMQRQGGFFWGSSSGSPDIREIMTVSCLGRSPDPLKSLLQEAKRWYLAKQKSNTTIYHPATGGRGHNYWHLATFRPSRPLDTISMSEEDKKAIIDDINQYLHPESRPWYATRGIPYRRGFLFYGPPGTGKTSLSFALAGVFGLDIYVLSLMDPNLSEEALKNLFSELPRRCIVLLEDIDSAGLRRKPGKQAKGETAAEGSEDEKKSSGGKRGRRSDNDDGISLSGLLNAIDGVASHEGRLLIMTSNHPEKLDDALIRPGRVDMKIGFGNATKEQAHMLFLQMFAPEAWRKYVHGESKLSNGSASLLTPTRKSGLEKTFVDLEKMKAQAKQFADIVPDDTFTPAEVQGFLLTRRHDSDKAIEEAPEWRQKLIAEKEERARKAAEEEAANE